MYPGYTLCERQKKILFDIGKLIFEIRAQVLCKHLWIADLVDLYSAEVERGVSCRQVALLHHRPEVHLFPLVSVTAGALMIL